MTRRAGRGPRPGGAQSFGGETQNEEEAGPPRCG